MLRGHPVAHGHIADNARRHRFSSRHALGNERDTARPFNEEVIAKFLMLEVLSDARALKHIVRGKSVKLGTILVFCFRF